MDSEELRRIASNNPAMTVPASQVVRRTQTHTGCSSSSPSSSPGHQHNNQHQHEHCVTLSDPSGEVETVCGDDESGDYEEYEEEDKKDVEKQEEKKKKKEGEKDESGWRRVVHHFSPSWFSTTMGTGIVSLLLIIIPYQADWLYWLSVIFFALNAALFACATVISLLRYTMYPETWGLMLHDPTNSLFLSTAPIGFATLVESWLFLCCPYWGAWSVYVAWAGWMVAAVASVAVTVSLMVLLISATHQQQLDRITAAQVLPLAATVVAAGTGVEVSHALLFELHPDHAQPAAALGTLLTSYVMWGMAVPFAMTVLVMYYHRLALHKLPPREVVVSSFLPLGPLGMGGYTIFYAGKVAREVLPRVTLLAHISAAGDILYVGGLLLSLFMWSFGLIWLVFALASIWSCRTFPFNMGWWGFTFPIGVFAISTIFFGTELPSSFFRVLGTIFSVCVILLWCVVAVGTVKGAWSGQLLNLPRLKSPAKASPQDVKVRESRDVDIDVEKGEVRE